MNPHLLARLITAMAGHHAPAAPAAKHSGQRARLAASMAKGHQKADIKSARKGALPPYAEQKHGATFGHNSGAAQGAFQSDAFQNDAFQVDGVN